jgi:hypothetical protein
VDRQAVQVSDDSGEEDDTSDTWPIPQYHDSLPPTSAARAVVYEANLTPWQWKRPS